MNAPPTGTRVMAPRLPPPPLPTQRRRRLLAAGLGITLLAVMTAVLLAGFRLASQMTARIDALQSASSLAAYPEAITQRLTSIRERLEGRLYLSQAVAEFGATFRQFDRELRSLEAHAPRPPAQFARALEQWRRQSALIAAVAQFRDQPYVETDAAGSQLSPAGEAYFAEVKRAQLSARANAERLRPALEAMAASMQAQASARAAQLRWLLFAGVAAAVVLAAIAAYLLLARGGIEQRAREAQQQTRDILATVREGFFLLDTDHRIGAVWSASLSRLFNREDFHGLSFEELLADRVPAATLATATKYVRLLWGDRVNENLIGTINPLGQVEVHGDNGHGGRDVRHLQFGFHRVMGAGGVRHVLVSVSDITSNVLLVRELAEAQQDSNRQVDMILGVARLNPLQLAACLDAADSGLLQVNAILKEPARQEHEFRGKIERLFVELHAIKGDAAAAGLESVAQRVHALEDLLAQLRLRPVLDGSDFLPAVLRLDELMGHLRSVRELGNRLQTAQLGASPVAAAGGVADSAAVGTAGPGTGRPGTAAPGVLDAASGLARLAARLAAESGKNFELVLEGFADVPARYATAVRDAVIQMLRNSAVHGIESPDVRRALAKPEVGTISARFAHTAEGCVLSFEDDGQGLDPGALKSIALRRKLVNGQVAATMDDRQAIALIFRPGFSTLDQVTLTAGRGVGMDVVARRVHDLGGSIAVASRAGRFTRFRVTLPPCDANAADAAEYA